MKELRVRVFLFLQRGAEKLCDVAHAELVGPGDEGTVTRDFVVPHSLRGGKHAGVADGFIFCFLHNFRWPPLRGHRSRGLPPDDT